MSTASHIMQGETNRISWQIACNALYDNCLQIKYIRNACPSIDFIYSRCKINQYNSTYNKQWQLNTQANMHELKRSQLTNQQTFNGKKSKNIIGGRIYWKNKWSLQLHCMQMMCIIMYLYVWEPFCQWDIKESMFFVDENVIESAQDISPSKGGFLANDE